MFNLYTSKSVVNGVINGICSASASWLGIDQRFVRYITQIPLGPRFVRNITALLTFLLFLEFFQTFYRTYSLPSVGTIL